MYREVETRIFDEVVVKMGKLLSGKVIINKGILKYT